VFRRIRRRRFLMDLPRGARLSFLRTDGLRLDPHFEPWIRPRGAAESMNDVFFHGRGYEAAWSPDVLLTFQVALGIRIRGVVIDAPFQVRSATVQHRRHGGVNGRGKGRGQGL
jgi:hypothetical protein